MYLPNLFMSSLARKGFTTSDFDKYPDPQLQQYIKFSKTTESSKQISSYQIK